MIIKYKKKRILFIKIFSVAVAMLFLFNIWIFIFKGDSVLNFLTAVFLVLLCFGSLYYQVARYDHQKITGQFGWPKIYFKDITAVKHFAGDIVIKTEKRSFGINTQVADASSLHKFIKILEQKTLNLN